MNLFIKKFVARSSNKNFHFKKSLGSDRYFSLLKVVNFVIGNSSSGISEAPYFKIPTINLGYRQKGRITPKSVINSKISSKAISSSIKRALNMKIKKIFSELKKILQGKLSIKSIHLTLKSIIRKYFMIIKIGKYDT